MMKSLKTFLALIGMLIMPFGANAQLTLDECQRLAQENYPLLKRYDLIERTTEYSIQSINRGYLPQLSVSGQGTYQSDVANLPDALTSMLESYGYDYKGLKKDQYKIAIDLNQVIWDGGNIEAQKDVTTMDGQVSRAQNDVDMYSIYSRVNDLFFGILLIEDKIRLNEDLQTLLQDNCRKMENRYSHGTAMKSDVDAIKAEYLKAKQDMISLVSMKQSYQKMLSIFINKDVTGKLQKPAATMPVTLDNKRPELSLYAAQISKNEAQKKLLDVGLRPKLSLFAQGYYGYPGYDMFGDMFDHDFTLNGIVGVKLTWNVSKFYTHKSDKRKLDLARLQIETAQETFLFNNSLQSTKELESIEQYRKMMQKDEEIISLRTSVRQAAESKLEHGVIDVNDLLQEITRENQAQTDYSSHEIEMLKNIYELKNTINQ